MRTFDENNPELMDCILDRILQLNEEAQERGEEPQGTIAQALEEITGSPYSEVTGALWDTIIRRLRARRLGGENRER